MEVIDSCVAFFQNTLASPSFQFLADLTLDLPCTYHVGDGFEIVERDGDVQRSNDFPFSNVQRQFPNQGCQDAMWDFVASCPNLSCLCIMAIQFLDVGRLDWKKSHNSRGLKVLSLDRVWVSVAAIKSLLQPHSTSSAPPALRRINLYEAKMHIEGGTGRICLFISKTTAQVLNAAGWGSSLTSRTTLGMITWNIMMRKNLRAGGREFFPESLVEYLG
ncbi:unnamed protein product [Clonostachys rhizophaga]|uniref:Uncharacterized protein n=1 Tax=Clonostachys rhizophaga TaxID=160324 RepID=A0A9N9V880_9HYPO|nr:unnamed protein product [Clonostachys rhizophaga]